MALAGAAALDVAAADPPASSPCTSLAIFSRKVVCRGLGLRLIASGQTESRFIHVTVSQPRRESYSHFIVCTRLPCLISFEFGAMQLMCSHSRQEAAVT